MAQNYSPWGTGPYAGQHPPPHPPPGSFHHPPAQQGTEPRIRLPPLASLAPPGSQSAEHQGHQHMHHPVEPSRPPPQELPHGPTHGPPPGQYINDPPPYLQAYHTQPPPPPPPQHQHQHQHQQHINGHYDDPRRHGNPNPSAYTMSQSAFYATTPASRDHMADPNSGERFEGAEARGYHLHGPVYSQGHVPPDGPPLHHMNASGHATGSVVSHAAAQERGATEVVGAIPNLLGEDRAHLVSTIKFELSMRQQPKAARACGAGERDRRTIDPPPVLQLHVLSDALSQEEIGKYLRHEPYVMTTEIYDETGTYECAKMPAEFKHQRRMTGSLVGNPFFGKDESGREGTFFPFGDLSVRSLGIYTLRFNLFMIDPQDPRRRAPNLAEITSAPFQSYAAKGFPGIQPSSKLVRVLREQGCIISIKKGHDKKRPYRDSAEPSEGEGDGDGDDDDDNASSSRRRRG